MKKNTGFVVVLFLWMVCQGCSFRSSSHSDIDDVSAMKQNELNVAFEELVRKHGVNTAAVAVIKGGKVVWQNQFGMQNSSTAASGETLFNIASLTKTLTAETVLRLVAQKKLSLSESMSSYWIDPDIKDDPRHDLLTAKMALSHTMGFMNWRFFSNDRKLKFLQEPGEGFIYSGEGVEYMTKYVEHKLNKPFEQIAKEVLFEPLNMTSASMSVDSKNYPRIAKPLDANGTFYGYYCWPDGWCSQPGEFSAAGNAVITLSDYTRFFLSSMNGEGINEKLKEERETIIGLESPFDCRDYHELICPQKTGYGLGWYISEFKDNKLIGHRGSDWSVVSIAYYYENSRDGLVIFFNAPNKAGIAAMVDALELLDPDSPELHGYRARLARK